MQKIKIIATLIIILSIALAKDNQQQILSKYTDKNNVLELKTDDIDRSVIDFPYMMIQTYAYWSNESVAFYPDYQKVGAALRESNPSVMVGRIDAASNGVHERYRLNKAKFPVIVLVVNNKTIHEYTGELKSQNIIKWAQKLSGSQISKELFINDKIEDLVKENQEVVVYFGESENDKNFDHFKKSALQNLDIQYAHTFSSQLREQNKAKLNSIIVFKSYDEKRNEMEGQIDAPLITNFVQKYAYPNLMEFESKAFTRIISQKNSALFFFSDNSDRSKSQELVLKELSLSMKGRILFTVVRINDTRYKDLERLFGLQDSDIPCIRILGFQGDQNKYKPDFKELNKQTVTKFITNFRIRRLIPYYNSEAIPADNINRPIKKVVANNFEQFVLQSEEDILIVFYNPDCKKCDDLLQQLEKLAKKISKNSNIIVASCDISKNEIPSAMFKDTPKIRFYKKGQKNKPEELPADKTNKEYLNLLKEKTSYPWVIDGKIDL